MRHIHKLWEIIQDAMELSKNLLFAEEEFGNDSILNGTSVKGSYNTMQFVLRLRDDIRSALNKNDGDYEKIQASSTSIHENIHWWQHIGSNFGFLFSLSYPAFAHLSKGHLEKIVGQGLSYKSIIEFDRKYYEKNGFEDNPDINTILNTYHDLEYAKLFALDNKNINDIIEDKRFFLTMGHCYHMFWSATINTLSATLDPTCKFIPAIDNWRENFKSLEKKEVVGFFIDTPVHISPLGIKAIYEGQAIFNQMQYLTVALNKDLTYSDFEKVGMLHGIYTEAFELFLEITKLNKPNNLLDSTVGLFLLVCDLAINPNNGFPLDIYDYEGFIIKNDPGMRFTQICLAVGKDPLEYLKKITSYSKEEYITLSKELSESICCKCPYESISVVLNWEKEQEISNILKEETILKFSEINLPIRLMFSKYFRFQQDKQKYPNVFCWFGYHSTSNNPNVEFEIVDSLYKKHHALYMDDFDGEIKPTIFDSYEVENIVETFNMFYAFNILYDLTLKWVYEKGNFTYNYKWLVGDRSEGFIPRIKVHFQKHFGIDIDTIKPL